MVIMSIFLIVMFLVFGYGIKDLFTGKMTKKQAGWFAVATFWVAIFLYIFLEI
jgi:hypothetical protein